MYCAYEINKELLPGYERILPEYPYVCGNEFPDDFYVVGNSRMTIYSDAGINFILIAPSDHLVGVVDGTEQ